MMLALRSLIYYWRTQLVIALGVAAATAVLTGALIVGDSMRGSLRALTIQRLGKIDELLIAEGFFRAELAHEIEQTPAFQESYSQALPAILFPGGTVETETETGVRRAGQVAVLGVEDAFWGLSQPPIELTQPLAGEGVAINQALADDLQITSEQVVAGKTFLTLRIPKQDQLPADSALGKQDDLIESLVDLKVVDIVPDHGLGRFGLHPSQSNPLNVYLPIELLQDSLRRTTLKHKLDSRQANVLLLSGKGDSPPAEESTQQLAAQFVPELADLGLSLKQIQQTYDGETISDFWTLTSDRMVLTDQAAEVIERAVPVVQPVFTYLANDICKSDQQQGIPYSMIASIDFDDRYQPLSSLTGQPIQPLAEDEIVLNQWAAADLDAKVGDTLVLTFFEPETTHGTQVERSIEMKLVDIARLTEPVEPYRLTRRGKLIPAVFDQRPAVANDPHLTPEVPGVTDAESIENWDLPFDTTERIRIEDDEYWANHRTTPKAFVSLETGQRHWRSRFGQVTGFRIPADQIDSETLADTLRSSLANHQHEFGMQLVPVKRRGLAASAGSTPFDVLFLALSMFVIGAALILVSLLFRLAFQQRAGQVGLLGAVGFRQNQIRRIWLNEMLFVSLIGAVIGVILGIGYAALMIWGLSTWWVGAISRPFLNLHILPGSLLIGLVSGLLVCTLTITWALRKTIRLSIRDLLAGQIEKRPAIAQSPAGRRRKMWSFGLLISAIGLACAATQLAGEAQAGSFMGAGFLVLVVLLMWMYDWLRKPDRIGKTEQSLSLTNLAMMNARRNPLRSALTVGLVAVASFLIVAVSAFRLTPTDRGTGGFDWVAQSSQPILEDLATPLGRAKTLGQQYALTENVIVLPLRYKSGEDASCNNLYQSTQPRVLGIPQQLVGSFEPKQTRTHQAQFAWAGSLAETEADRTNPWRLLADEGTHTGSEHDPIPAVIDKNTANYSLKIYSLGTILKVIYDTGETVHFKTVGFLNNTILQGSLIISERNFETAFPDVGGYQYFLIRDGEPATTANIEILEEQLGDYGFDARSAPKLLANLMAVQNTYLSTFQTLGALGLLLGTFGLAAVQVRSVLERKQELGLMQATGFTRRRLQGLVFLENLFLLLAGLLVGIVAAICTTLPHWLVGAAAIPWLELLVMFGGIAGIGLLTSWLGSRSILRLPLLESLRT